jgi:hypothetical protein
VCSQVIATASFVKGLQNSHFSLLITEQQLHLFSEMVPVVKEGRKWAQNSKLLLIQQNNECTDAI